MAPRPRQACAGEHPAELASPGQFPALHAAIGAGAFDHDTPDGEFAFGLERILDGVAALIRPRS